MKKFAIIGVGFLVLLCLLFLGGCNSYNGLVKSKQNVDQSWAQVQNVYQRRSDLIPNLVSTVSGAANFEKSTLTEITKARASVGQVNVNPNSAPNSPEDLKKFDAAQGQLSSALSRLLVVSERYPDLKANSSFLGLQAELAGSENRIAVERKRFNEAVQGYDTRVETFPTLIFARMFGFLPKPYFAAREGSDVAPKVEFNFGNSPATNK
ncbi:MAG: LemA family protein [Verrucomicrobiales bacterium]|nr:LemA family protein [Verrucomicrobiales bacterium]